MDYHTLKENKYYLIRKDCVFKSELFTVIEKWQNNKNKNRDSVFILGGAWHAGKSSYITNEITKELNTRDNTYYIYIDAKEFISNKHDKGILNFTLSCISKKLNEKLKESVLLNTGQDFISFLKKHKRNLYILIFDHFFELEENKIENLEIDFFSYFSLTTNLKSILVGRTPDYYWTVPEFKNAKKYFIKNFSKKEILEFIKHKKESKIKDPEWIERITSGIPQLVNLVTIYTPEKSIFKLFEEIANSLFPDDSEKDNLLNALLALCILNGYRDEFITPLYSVMNSQNYNDKESRSLFWKIHSEFVKNGLSVWSDKIRLYQIDKNISFILRIYLRLTENTEKSFWINLNFKSMQIFLDQNIQYKDIDNINAYTKNNLDYHIINTFTALLKNSIFIEEKNNTGIIAKHINSRKKGIIYINGESGTGKTFFLEKLIEKIEDNPQDYDKAIPTRILDLYHFKNQTRIGFLSELYNSLVTKFERTTKSKITSQEYQSIKNNITLNLNKYARDFFEFGYGNIFDVEDSIVKFVNFITEKQPIVIIIDSLEKLVPSIGSFNETHFLTNESVLISFKRFFKQIEKNMIIIIAGRETKDDVAKFFGSNFQITNLTFTGFNEKQFIDYINKISETPSLINNAPITAYNIYNLVLHQTLIKNFFNRYKNKENNHIQPIFASVFIDCITSNFEYFNDHDFSKIEVDELFKKTFLSKIRSKSGFISEILSFLPIMPRGISERVLEKILQNSSNPNQIPDYCVENSKILVKRIIESEVINNIYFLKRKNNINERFFFHDLIRPYIKPKAYQKTEYTKLVQITNSVINDIEIQINSLINGINQNDNDLFNKFFNYFEMIQELREYKVDLIFYSFENSPEDSWNNQYEQVTNELLYFGDIDLIRKIHQLIKQEFNQKENLKVLEIKEMNLLNEIGWVENKNTKIKFKSNYLNNLDTIHRICLDIKNTMTYFGKNPLSRKNLAILIKIKNQLLRNSLDENDCTLNTILLGKVYNILGNNYFKEEDYFKSFESYEISYLFIKSLNNMHLCNFYRLLINQKFPHGNMFQLKNPPTLKPSYSLFPNIELITNYPDLIDPMKIPGIFDFYENLLLRIHDDQIMYEYHTRENFNIYSMITKLRILNSGFFLNKTLENYALNKEYYLNINKEIESTIIVDYENLKTETEFKFKDCLEIYTELIENNFLLIDCFLINQKPTEYIKKYTTNISNFISIIKNYGISNADVDLIEFKVNCINNQVDRNYIRKYEKTMKINPSIKTIADILYSTNQIKKIKETDIEKVNEKFFIKKYIDILQYEFRYDLLRLINSRSETNQNCMIRKLLFITYLTAQLKNDVGLQWSIYSNLKILSKDMSNEIYESLNEIIISNLKQYYRVPYLLDQRLFVLNKMMIDLLNEKSGILIFESAKAIIKELNLDQHSTADNLLQPLFSSINY